jgi:hypothetical protein
MEMLKKGSYFQCLGVEWACVGLNISCKDNSIIGFGLLILFFLVILSEIIVSNK